jgi:predicted  nucleic acid-binding Zn-ribbon protein
LIQELKRQISNHKKKEQEFSSVTEELYKHQQNSETLSQELSESVKKFNELSFKLERSQEEVKAKEQMWKNKLEKTNQENVESMDRQAERNIFNLNAFLIWK